MSNFSNTVIDNIQDKLKEVSSSKWKKKKHHYQDLASEGSSVQENQKVWKAPQPKHM